MRQSKSIEVEGWKIFLDDRRPDADMWKIMSPNGTYVLTLRGDGYDSREHAKQAAIETIHKIKHCVTRNEARTILELSQLGDLPLYQKTNTVIRETSSISTMLTQAFHERNKAIQRAKERIAKLEQELTVEKATLTELKREQTEDIANVRKLLDSMLDGSYVEAEAH